MRAVCVEEGAARYQGPAGLAPELRLGNHEQQQRESTAGQQRQRERTQDCRPKLLAELSAGGRRGHTAGRYFRRLVGLAHVSTHCVEITMNVLKKLSGIFILFPGRPAAAPDAAPII